MLLERVALHQTRLNAPGLTIDGRGVVIGTHALVVTSSLDRLVALMAALSNEGLLARLADGMVVQELAGKKGAKSWALRMACPVVDLADRVRRVASLVMGHTFVGAGRHYVEHRDATAPFGFDTPSTLDPGKGVSLYHRAYTAAFDVSRDVSPEKIILALSPRPVERRESSDGERWVLAEEGPGRALIGFLARSNVPATVGEALTTSVMSDEPTRRFLFVIPVLPRRLRSLARDTPGLTSFSPTGPATADEEGFAHPIDLRGMAAFAGPRVTLFRGRGDAPIVIDEGLPRVSVTSLVRFSSVGAEPVRALTSSEARANITMPLRLVAKPSDSGGTSAAWVPLDELELLRRLLYTVGRRALEDTEIALTTEGALVRSRASLLLPVGIPLWAISPAVMIPVGFDVVPHVSAAVLEATLEVGGGDVVLLRPEGAAALFPRDAFMSAERALLTGPRWAPLTLRRIDVDEVELPEVTLESVDLGLFPLRDLP